MPVAPGRACARPGCPARAASGHSMCNDCWAKTQRQRDRARPNSAERGYGSNWRELRKLILHRDPICKACNISPSSEVDHILAKKAGGTDAMENLQGLCKPCHSSKTAREDARWGAPAGVRG